MIKIMVALLLIIPPLWILWAIVRVHYNPLETNDDWDN